MSTATTGAQGGIVRQPSPAKRSLFSGSSPVAIAIMLLTSGPALAGGPVLPSGGNFVAGAGSIAGVGGGLTISQQSARGIIDWKSFSIGQGGAVQFNNGAGATLNRVTGGDLSSILGTLKATGSLYLINPNGVVVGASGVVVTNGSFVASTLDVANNAFMAGGTLVFKGSTNASVKNLGAISSTGGDVILIAHDVANTGTINAPRGTAALAAGQEVLVQDSADEHVFVDAGGGDVTNSGTIDAAQAELKAAGGNVYALAGTSGVIRATGTAVKNGEVWLTANGGDVEISGTVSAQNADGSGGRIYAGDWSTAKTEIAAGAVLNASATAAKGDGGSVKVLGKATVFAGTAKARGGSASGNGGAVETSGQTLSVAGGAVDAGAANGKGGSWLLDPYDVTIDAATATTIGNSLATNSVTVTAGLSGASGPGVSNSGGVGDITVNSAITSSGNATSSLTLSAYRNVNVNASVTVGASALTLEADNNANGTGGQNNGGTGIGTVIFNNGAKASSASAISIIYNPSGTTDRTHVNGTSYVTPDNFAGNVTGGGALTAYMIVNTIYDLQNIGNNLAGNYWLNDSIDGTGFSNFTPIGSSATPFTGVLNSSNQYAISNLTIASSQDTVGLFGRIGAAGGVGNFSLGNVSVTGSSGAGVNLGALAGENDGAISNVSVAGSVTAAAAYANAGGIVGTNKGTLDQVRTGTNSGATMALAGGMSANVGGLAGFNAVLATISNSKSDGTITGGLTNTGGLAGLNNGLITSSNPNSSLATTSAAANLGGAVGMNDNSGLLNFLSSDGTVVNSGVGNNVGGAIGRNTATGSVSGAVATAAVQGMQGAAIGGFVGLNQGSLVAVGASGSVSGTGYNGLAYIGGLAGSMTGSGSITAGFAQGPVTTTATSNIYLGGFIGGNFSSASQSISQSYATGYLKGPAGAVIGGFVGADVSGGHIASSYWDTETTGVTDLTKGAGNYANGVGITGETTQQLQAALPASFNQQLNVGGNTVNLWGILPGQSFPYFSPAYQNATPQVISGYVYNSFTNQTALPGVTLGVAINGDSSSGATTSGANGYYVLLVGPNNNNGVSMPEIPTSNGNILLTITNGGSGNTLIYGATGSVAATTGVAGSGATLFGGSWLRIAPATTAVAATQYSIIQADLASAVGTNNPGGMLYTLNFPGMTPTFSAFNMGTRLDLEFPNTTTNELVIDKPLMNPGGAIVLNSTNDPGTLGSTRGQVSQTAPITAGGLVLKGIGASFGITNTSNSFGQIAISDASTSPNAVGSAGIYDTVNLSIATTAGMSGINTGILVLDDPGHTVSQASNNFLTVGSLSLLGSGANYQLTGASNLVDSLAANTNNGMAPAGSVVLADAKNLLITTITTGSNIAPQGILTNSGVTSGIVGLELNGAFTVSQDAVNASAINTSNLVLTQISGASGGTFALTNTANAVGTLAANTDIGGIAGGTVSLADSVALTIGTVTAGGVTTTGVTTQTLNLIDSMSVGQTAIVTASDLLLEGGAFNLDLLNLIGTVAANAGAVGVTDAPTQTLNVGSEINPLTSTLVTGITTIAGVGLQADTMTFASGINAPAQPVLLETTTVGRAVNIGAGTGGLLIPANLQVTAGTLVIGGDGGSHVTSTISEGPISVNAPINFANVTNLALVSNGTVTQTTGSTITASGLVVEGTNISLTENNSVQRIAMLATGTMAMPLGNLSFTDIANAVSITSIGAPGTLTASGLAAAGSITLTATGTVTQSTPISGVGGVLPSLALLGSVGIFQLTDSSNTVAALAGNTLRINLAVMPIGTLMLGSAGTTNGLNAATLTINDTGMVGESLAINVGNLELLGAGGQYNLNNSANMVGTLAANTGSITLSDAGTLAVGAAGGTINVNATGIVSLSADHMVLSGGTISTSGTGVFLSTLTNATPITLGTGGAGLDLTAADLNRITANALVIGGVQSGDVTINQAIAPIHISSLGLQTAGNVSQTAGSTISVASLGINANNIALQEANVVGTLALQANLAASFSDSIDLTIGTVTAPASLTGARALGGALEIATTGALTLAGGVTGTLPAMMGGGGGMGLGGGFGSAANAVILATGGDFTNNFGANAITPTNGRFLVFMGAPANNRGTSLVANPLYNHSFNSGNDTFAPIANTGNRFVYSYAPFLTVTAGPDSKVYNGASQTSSAYTVTGVLQGDSADLAYAGQAAIGGAGTHVGSFGLTASLGTLTSDLGYQFQFQTGTLTITPLAVNLTGAKIYDGTAGVTASALSVANLALGDTVTVASGSGTLSGKDAGPQTITGFGNLMLGGASATDYMLMGATSSVTINARPVALTGARTYDGGTSAAAAILSIANIVGGDAVTLASGSATLASQHAGSQAIAGVGSLMLGGATANDYTLTGATGAVTINPLAVTLSGTRTYDGTTNADFSILSVANAVNGDTINLASGAATLAAATVGSETITSTGTLALGNNGFGDYTLNGATGAVTVTAMGIRATVLSGTRVYDGMTDAPAAILTITNKVMGDDVSLTGTGVLASKNVGLEALTLTNGSLTGLSLTGAAAANYSLLNGSGSVTVTAAPLTVVAQAATKLYDGGTSSSTLPGYQGTIYAGDTPGFSQSYAGKNVGNGIVLTPSGVVNDGNGGLNYSYSYQAGNVGVINPLPIALSGSRTYDGTSTISSANLYITNLMGGDSASTVSLTPATVTLATRNAVGNDAITSLGTLGITGSGASNYTLTNAFGSVTITQATLTLQAVTDSRVYNGMTNSSQTPTAMGFVMGDSISGLTQSFMSKDASLVANGSTITVNNGYMINDGNGGNNYSVNLLPAFGTITPLPVVVSGARTYDGTTVASAGILSIANDLDGVNVGLSGTGMLLSKNAGSQALVSVGGVLSGLSLTGVAANDYTLVGGSGNVNVGQAQLTVQPSSTFKIYDGTTTSSQTPLVTGTIVAGDTRQFTQAYSTKNAGNSIPMTVTGIVNDGNGGNNYSYNYVTGFLLNVGTIGTRTVSLAGGTRAYDGTTGIAPSVLSVSNKVMGDDVSFTSGTGILMSKNAGVEQIASLGSLALGGADAANYSLPFFPTGSVTITQAPLTVTAAVNSKTYDGTAAAAATPTVTSGTIFAGDTGTFTESYASANAGTGLTLTPTGSVSDGIGGNGNYAITFAPIMTGAISPLAVSVTGMRVYDGTATVDSSILAITNDLDGANLTLTGSGTLSSQHAGVQTITGPGTFALNGSAKNNYTLMGASSAVTITPLAVTLSGMRAYDGTGGAASAILSVANKVGADTITVASGSATLAGKNVGPEAITNPGTLALGNNGFGDYTLSGGSGSVNITAATLTAGLTGTVTKTYDGTVAATLAAANYTLTGIVGGDAVTLNNPAAGSYDTKNVGAGKTVSVTGLTLGGAGAGNYMLAANSASAAIGTITPATLTYSAPTVSQSYGAATNSFSGTVTGFVGGETVQSSTTGTAAFASATGATTDIGSYAITGSGLTANNGNYVFVQAAGNATALTITPVTLTAGLTGTVTKTYDGTTAATLAAGNYTLTSTVNGDVITLNNPTSGTYDNKTVGTGKTVSVTGLTISGAKAGDYVLAANSASGAIGTISAATLTAGLTGTVAKTYDGTTAATLAAANYTLTGIVGGDAVTLNNPTAGSYDTKNVGAGKTVSVTGLTLGGAGAGNYVLASGGAAGAIGTITPATVTASLTGTVSKTYDGTVNASLAAANYTLSGVVTGDSVTLNNPASGSYNNANAGSGKAVTVTGLAISGPGATNYTLFAAGASANIGVIAPKSVTYSVADASSSFGIAPVLGAATLTGILPADSVTATVGLFNGPNSVAANALTPVGFYSERVTALAGAAAGNYAIAAAGNTTGTLTVNAAMITPGQIINPNVTPPVSQTIAQASLQLQTFGATSFVVSNGAAVTATLSGPTPGGDQVLTITTTVNNVPVTYTLPVAGGGGGGGILGAYSSFDDLLAAAQTTQQASN